MYQTTLTGNVFIELGQGWRLELVRLLAPEGETFFRALVAPTGRHAWGQLPRLPMYERHRLGEQFNQN